MIQELAANTTGLLGLAMGLFFLGFALRSDRRLNRRIEAQVERLWARVGQLEHVLTDAGMTLPPWPPEDAGHRHRGDHP